MRITIISLSILLLLVIVKVGSQFPDCTFQEVELIPCLTNGIERNMTDICCQAVNQALSTGQECLCSILFSANLFLDAINPVDSSSIGVELPGCTLSAPSLSACQAQVPIVTSTPSPVTDEGISAVLPVLPPSSTGLVPSKSPDNQLLPNNETESVPAREGQDSMDVVSQVNQNGSSRVRPIQVTHHVLCIMLALLAIYTQDILQV